MSEAWKVYCYPKTILPDDLAIIGKGVCSKETSIGVTGSVLDQDITS